MGRLPNGLQRGERTRPKRIIAIADYGQYGHLTETTIDADGKRTDERVNLTPDGRPVWEPYILERAFVCQRLNWQLLPDDLDEAGLELKHASESLFVFDTFRQYATDLERLTENQQQVIESVEGLRDLIKRNNG